MKQASERMRRLLATAAVVASLVACGPAPATPSDGPTGPTLASASQPTAATVTPSATSSATASPTPSPSPSPTPEPVAVLIGAGDICRVDYPSGAQKTAALVAADIKAHAQDVVFTLGDNSNDKGTAAQYKACFDKTWGAFKSRMHPVIGNHDLMTSAGAPYYAYFGASAGAAGLGWYSYDLPANWHVIVLNGLCSYVHGCGKNSTQEKWLRSDLAASAGKHILAMWHPPEFSSGGHGNTNNYITWWRDLYAAHAEIVLNGHDHDYERFARQSPDGIADPNGIREFVCGTGGALHSPIKTRRPNSEVLRGGTYGVLKLTLGLHSYSWQFIPIAGSSFTDSGSTATHF